MRFGMPIGGVLFVADAVVPYAIGVDIGCGVQIARTNLVRQDSLTPKKLRATLRQIQRDFPTRFRRPWPGADGHGSNAGAGRNGGTGIDCASMAGPRPHEGHACCGRAGVAMASAAGTGRGHLCSRTIAPSPWAIVRPHDKGRHAPRRGANQPILTSTCQPTRR
jgi:hypothetical protein